jgi:hypothetical protein
MSCNCFVDASVKFLTHLYLCNKHLHKSLIKVWLDMGPFALVFVLRNVVGEGKQWRLVAQKA